jgi:hypothetical protein
MHLIYVYAVCECELDWIRLVQGWGQWQPFFSMVMNLCIPCKMGNYLLTEIVIWMQISVGRHFLKYVIFTERDIPSYWGTWSFIIHIWLGPDPDPVQLFSHSYLGSTLSLRYILMLSSPLLEVSPKVDFLWGLPNKTVHTFTSLSPQFSCLIINTILVEGYEVWIPSCFNFLCSLILRFSWFQIFLSDFLSLNFPSLSTSHSVMDQDTQPYKISIERILLCTLEFWRIWYYTPY